MAPFVLNARVNHSADGTRVVQGPPIVPTLVVLLPASLMKSYPHVQSAEGSPDVLVSDTVSVKEPFATLSTRNVTALCTTPVYDV
jgi:hypothetical protein